MCFCAWKDKDSEAQIEVCLCAWKDRDREAQSEVCDCVLVCMVGQRQ